MWFHDVTQFPFVTRFIGVASIAIGDSFAAGVGMSLGRNKIFSTNKTLEGSLAFTVSTLMALNDYSAENVILVLILAIYEAFTCLTDNFSIPLLGFGLLRIRQLNLGY